MSKALTNKVKLNDIIRIKDYGTNTAAFQAAIDALPAAGGTIDGDSGTYTGIGTLTVGSKRVHWTNFRSVNGLETSGVLPGNQTRVGPVIANGQGYMVTPDLIISAFSDANAILPALFLTKDSTVGVNGAGLAKIQWRGTNSAGTKNIDGGRIDSVVTDASSTNYSARMSVSPHVDGNSEVQGAMSWEDGVTVPAIGALAAVTITSGGTGYTVGNTLTITSAGGGTKATALVTKVSTGAITALSVANNGYGFTNGETLTFTGGSGSSVAGTALVPSNQFMYGHGTLNAARKLLLNNEVVAEYDYNFGRTSAKFDTIEVQNTASPAAFGEYGEGIVNVGEAYYVRNVPTLQYDDTSTKVRFNRDFGHRVVSVGAADSPYTMDGLPEIIYINANLGNVTITLPAASFFGTSFGSRVVLRRTDSSANVVKIQRASSDTINGGTVVTLAPASGMALTSNGLTSWTTAGTSGSTFNASDFGVIADGSTDDSTAINSLITTVNALGGGIVELPAGTIKANIVLKTGIILKGQGRGQNATGVGGTPMPPVYTFSGGGTTIIPQSAASPVITADGTSGSENWGEFSIRDLKVSNTGGAIVSGSIGIRATLSREIDITNVEIRNMDTGLQLGGTAAGTTWSFLITSSSIQDCGAYGLLMTDRPQSGTPGTINSLDIRRCTGYGAYIRDMVGVVWTGGTVADCVNGVYVLGDITRAISFNGIQFETNTTKAVIVGLTGQAPVNISFNNCSFWEGRGSPFAGSVAIDYVAGVKLSLINCSWQGFEKCVNYTGGVDVLVMNPHYTNCTAFGIVYNLDLGSFSYVVADSSTLLGLSSTGLFAKSSDSTTRANNFHIRPSTQNSPLYSGLAPSGTAGFTQWSLYTRTDVDNAGYLRLEASNASYAAIGTSVSGTGTAIPLRVQLTGGQLGFFGSNGTTKPSITGSRGGNAALADLLTKLASMGLITDTTTA